MNAEETAQGKGERSPVRREIHRNSYKPEKGAKAAPPPASQNAAKSLQDDVAAELDAIGANCDDEAQEETESRRTDSDDDGTGANEHVPAGAAQKRHRVNELHEALRRIADLEARLKVSDVENFVHCKSC